MNGNCVECHLILCIYHKTHSPRLFKPVACAGCQYWGKRSAEDDPFWCIIAVDILGMGTGVCPPQARSTEATRVAYH